MSNSIRSKARNYFFAWNYEKTQTKTIFVASIFLIGKIWFYTKKSEQSI